MSLYYINMDNIKLYNPTNKTEANKVVAKYQSEIKRLHKVFGTDGVKHCNVCNEVKPIEQFNNKQAKCKSCNKTYYRNLYHEKQKKLKKTTTPSQ
jgi:uncharacterized paraquat-inducible protein A